MNTGLAQLYSAYQPKAKKKLKRKPQRSDTNAALVTAARRPPHALPTKDPLPTRSGKSADPQRLPKLPRLQSQTPDPSHISVKQVLDRSASSAADITLDRLEKLQFKSITARSEWLLVQERKFALGMLNRHLADASLDEMEELMLENKYEVLMHKHNGGKRDFSYLPPLRRASPL